MSPRRTLSVATSQTRRSQPLRSHHLPITTRPQSLLSSMPLLLAMPLLMHTPARTTAARLTTMRASTTLLRHTASHHTMHTMAPQATLPAARPLLMLLVVLLFSLTTHSMVSTRSGDTHQTISRLTSLRHSLRLRLAVRRTVLPHQPPLVIPSPPSPLWSLSRWGIL